MIKLKDIVLEIGESTSLPYKTRLARTYDNKEDKDNKRMWINEVYTFEIDEHPGWSGVIDLYGEIDYRDSKSGVKRDPDKTFGELSVNFDVYPYGEGGMFKSSDLGLKVMFRVMSTVLQSMKKLLKKYPELKINTLILEPSEDKSSNLKGKGTFQRMKLFEKYIFKTFGPYKKTNNTDGYRLVWNKPLK